MSARNAVVALAAIVAIALPLVVVIADAANGWPSGGFYAVFAPTIVVFAAVGWLISVRQPGNVIGPLLLLFALVFAAYLPIDLLLRLGSTSIVVQVAASLSAASDAPMFIVIAMVLILFPDGRLPSPRWRWTAVLAAIGITAAFAGFTLNEGPLALSPSLENPIGVPGFPGAVIGEIGYVILVVLLVASIGALVTRWRRGDPTERAQLKWISAAAICVVITEAVNLATHDASDPVGDPVVVVLATVATALIPAAIGVAVLRYRLYEIDRIISRTLTYGGVTVALFAVFVAANLVAQWALSPFTSGNAIAVAGSTLLAAAAFSPLRSRLQRVVDRRFDRGRYDAEQTIDAFADRLRDELDLATVRDVLQRTTGAALQPTTAAVWLRGGSPR